MDSMDSLKKPYLIYPSLVSFQIGRTGIDDVNIRSEYFEKPGPASTGIPLNYLAYEGMLTEFETIAIVGNQ